MHYVADLHLHSKYSRAVSPSMTLPVMAQFARQKGLDILTVSDWTHPIWFREIQGQLEEAGEGVYKIKDPHKGTTFKEGSQSSKIKTTTHADVKAMAGGQSSKSQKDILFLLSTEISSIYKQGDKLRRIHNLIFVPNLETAEKVSKELLRRGCNLSADGRPIIGLSAKNLLELILAIDERSLLIPCHIWTPHFGVYGSKSGFDSLEEAFGDLAKYVYGVETGISSDPEMNWRVEELSNRSILSFSDAHSPANMAREATAFELSEPSYENIRQAFMRTSKLVIASDPPAGGERGNPVEKGIAPQEYLPLRGGASSSLNKGTPRNDNRIAYTIEFYPEEGKYHYSGHRTCKISFSPQEIKEHGKICPVCKREFTEGVALRIEQLAGAANADGYEEKISESGVKWYTDGSKRHPPYVKLVRLEQIIGSGMGLGAKSIKVKAEYDKLMREFGSELTILLKSTLSEIEKITNAKIAEGVGRVRKGKLKIDPGYDGEYGVVKIWDSAEQNLKGKEAGEKISEGQLGLDI